MGRTHLFGVVLFALALASSAMAETRYKTGQVWAYKTRPADPASKLKIWTIEQNSALGPIYHISVVGVHLGGRPEPTELGHLPVSAKTLDASVTAVTPDDGRFPDPAPGVAQWRSDKGGVFDIPMREIVGTIDATIPRDR